MQQERWDFSLSLVLKVREKIAYSVTSRGTIRERASGRRENAFLIREKNFQLQASGKHAAQALEPWKELPVIVEACATVVKRLQRFFTRLFSVSNANALRSCFQAKKCLFLLTLNERNFSSKDFQPPQKTVCHRYLGVEQQIEEENCFQREKKDWQRSIFSKDN